MKKAVELVSELFARWFHKRNIIIISERKVKHIPISGHLQFIAIAMLSVGFVWASYSTGSFIAARSALKEQGQALRSVTNAHIESSLGVNFKPAVDDNVDVGPYKRDSATPAVNTAAAALSGMDKAKLVARIALLEGKVIELKNTNEAIVQRVQEKTSGRLDNLESIVKQTGLNMSELKRQLPGEKKLKASRKADDEADDEGAGGPYIPDDSTVTLSPQAKDMLGNLDELAMVSKIVNTLPLAEPISNYQEHSSFGHRIDPFNGHMAFHSGLDMAGPTGAKIHSTAAGVVVSAGRNGAYGNAIDIDHGFGVVTRYGHLSEILVKEGQKISKNEVIGIQGSTGRSTGAHLHYEVRYHDQAMNPKNFLEAGHHVLEE